MTIFSGTDRTAGQFFGTGFGPVNVTSTADERAQPTRVEDTSGVEASRPGRKVSKIRRSKTPSAAPEAVNETGGQEHARTDAGHTPVPEVVRLRSTLDRLRHVVVNEDARQQLEQVELVRAGRRVLGHAAASADTASDAALLALQHGHGDPAAAVEEFILHEGRRAACQRALATYPAHAQPCPPAVREAVDVAVAQLRGALPSVDPPLIVASLAAWRERVDRRSVQLGAPAYSSTPPTPMPPRPTDLEQSAIEAWEAWTQVSRAVVAQVRVLADTAAALTDADQAVNVLAGCDAVLCEQLPPVQRQAAAVQALIVRANAQRIGMEI